MAIIFNIKYDIVCALINTYFKSMELKQLRAFVAVAEELHFGQAARRMGMSQPPLSRTIAQLEADIGAQLLLRNNRSVRITPAGEALLRQARELLSRADAAERSVRRIAAGEVGRLRVGYVPWGALRILPRALRQMRKRWPGIDVRLDEHMSRSQVEQLQRGNLDIGILNRNMVDTAGLSVETVETTRLVAAVPSAWELGARDAVRLAELAPYPFVLFPHHWVPNYTETFEAACERSGFTPRVIQEVGQTFTLFNMVANELGIGLVQDSARHLKVEGVSLVAISDMAEEFSSALGMAWVEERTTPAVRAMLKAIRGAVQEELSEN